MMVVFIYLKAAHLISPPWKQEGKLEGWVWETGTLLPLPLQLHSSPEPGILHVPFWPQASGPSSWLPQSLPSGRCWPVDQKQRPVSRGTKRVREDREVPG